MDMKLKNYSSGMQVRLAFTLAINAHAEILLMDEVLAVGDSNFQAKCIDEFNSYKKQGKTVVLVSHDLSTIKRYCDRSLLLNKAKIVKIGKPDIVIEKYLEINMSSESTLNPSKSTPQKNSSIEPGVIITEVDFLNSKQEMREKFKAGEKITARINFYLRKEVTSPVVGVAIYNSDGVEIFGPNTQTSNYSIDAIGPESYVDFIFDSENLFTGRYYLTVGLFDSSGTRAIDFVNKGFSFNLVSNKNNQNGIVELKNKWSHGKK